MAPVSLASRRTGLGGAGIGDWSLTSLPIWDIPTSSSSRLIGTRSISRLRRKIAATLEQHQSPEGKFPFRVNARTGEIKYGYTCSQLWYVWFFEKLAEITGDSQYRKYGEAAFRWLLNNPVKTNQWLGLYGDIASGAKSYDQWVGDPRGGALVLAAHITADPPENPYKLNVVFVTDIDLISDWFFYNRSHGETNLDFDNVTFVLNAVDVLAGDKTYLELRKRRPELRTLTGVEKRTAKFVQDRINKTKEADDEAKAALQTAQHQFDNKRMEIEKDPKLSPPERDELIRRLKEGEERRLDVQKAQIDLRKQQEIDEIKNATEHRIRETERQVMAMAVIVPPIPAIVLGVVLLLLRLGRERQYIAPERRIEQKPRKK